MPITFAKECVPQSTRGISIVFHYPGICVRSISPHKVKQQDKVGPMRKHPKISVSNLTAQRVCVSQCVLTTSVVLHTLTYFLNGVLSKILLQVDVDNPSSTRCSSFLQTSSLITHTTFWLLTHTLRKGVAKENHHPTWKETS